MLRFVNEGSKPGDKVCGIQAFRRVELGNLKYSVDPHDSDTAHTQNRKKHRCEGRSQTSQGTGGNIHESADKIGEGDIVKSC